MFHQLHRNLKQCTCARWPQAMSTGCRGLQPSGSPGDPDIFGAQQYAPLLDLVVPEVT